MCTIATQMSSKSVPMTIWSSPSMLGSCIISGRCTAGRPRLWNQDKSLEHGKAMDFVGSSCLALSSLRGACHRRTTPHR